MQNDVLCIRFSKIRTDLSSGLNVIVYMILTEYISIMSKVGNCMPAINAAGKMMIARDSHVEMNMYGKIPESRFPKALARGYNRIARTNCQRHSKHDHPSGNGGI